MAKRIRHRGNREICEPVTNLIADYLSDRLSPEVRSEFEQHMGICPDCVAFLNTYKKTLRLTRSFLKEVGKGKPAFSAGRSPRPVKGRAQKSSSRR